MVILNQLSITWINKKRLNLHKFSLNLWHQHHLKNISTICKEIYPMSIVDLTLRLKISWNSWAATKILLILKIITMNGQDGYNTTSLWKLNQMSVLTNFWLNMIMKFINNLRQMTEATIENIDTHCFISLSNYTMNSLIKELILSKTT